MTRVTVPRCMAEIPPLGVDGRVRDGEAPPLCPNHRRPSDRDLQDRDAGTAAELRWSQEGE